MNITLLFYLPRLRPLRRDLNILLRHIEVGERTASASLSLFDSLDGVRCELMILLT